MNHRADPHLTAVTHVRAGEDGRAGGDEHVALDLGPVHVRVGSHQHVVAEHDGVALAAAQHGVLHHDAALADLDPAALRGQDGAEQDAAVGSDGDVAAHDRGGSHVGRLVHARPLALVLDEHSL